MFGLTCFLIYNSLIVYTNFLFLQNFSKPVYNYSVTSSLFLNISKHKCLCLARVKANDKCVHVFLLIATNKHGHHKIPPSISTSSCYHPFFPVMLKERRGEAWMSKAHVRRRKGFCGGRRDEAVRGNAVSSDTKYQGHFCVYSSSVSVLCCLA